MNCGNHHGGRRKGPSSYWMHDHLRVFELLDLGVNDRFLDVGCGVGDYSLEAARRINGTGAVYALDVNPGFLDIVSAEAKANRLQNLQPILADASKPLPLKDASIDTCLIATSLHALNGPCAKEGLIEELFRVLSVQGSLFVIECHKKNMGFGPPLEYRISPSELMDLLIPHGFEAITSIDLGFNYMCEFRKRGPVVPDPRGESDTTGA